MANVFHEVHGHNVHLSANNTTATRVDKKDNSNGVVFSSRPLRNGETFEVQLDGESEHVLRSGLEIGITDLDPVTLRSSMPRTATDLHTGLTVMVSGQKIAANGRQVDTIKRNVYDLQIGGKIYLNLDGNSATFSMDGETIVRVNVTRWPQVYAVVELYGKAETISVTSNFVARQVTSQVPGQGMPFPSSPSSTMEEDSMVVRSKLEEKASAKVENQSVIEENALSKVEDQSAAEEDSLKKVEQRLAMEAREPEMEKERSQSTEGKSTGMEEKSPGLEGKSPGMEGKSPGVEEELPGMEGKSPGMEGKSPGEEGKLPGKEGKSPGVEGKSPGMEGKSPGVEGKSPGVEGKSPGMEGKSPGVEGKLPGMEGKSPGVERKSPGIEGKSPDMEGKSLGVEGKSPGMEGKSPGVEGKSPGVEGKLPGMEGKSPGVEGKSPGMEGKSSGVEEKLSDIEGKSPCLEPKSARVEVTSSPTAEDTSPTLSWTSSPSTPATQGPIISSYSTGVPELMLQQVKVEIEAMIEKMQRQSRDDLVSLLQNVNKVYEYSSTFLGQTKWREQAASHMVHLQAGHVIKGYFKQLQKWGLNNSLHFDVYYTIRSICWNYADDSNELRIQFGEAGLLEACTDELKCLHSTYRDSKITESMVDTALGIIHNCAKAEANRTLLRRYHFVEAAQPYTDTSHNTEVIVLHAVLAISYVMEENEASIARINQGTLSTLIQRVQMAIQDDLHVSEGWHAYEICDGLANLAAEHHNLMLAVELGAPGLFAMLLMLANDDHERRVALNALDAHVCPESCQVLAKHDLVLPVLENTKQGADCPDVREKAAQVHRRLTQLIEETKALESTDGGGQGGMVQQVTDHVRGGMGEFTTSPSAAVLSCPYRRVCTAFFLSLQLNSDFFNPAYDMCYCEKCHSERKDRDYYQRGDPPKLYGLPLGWCRFALFLPSRAEALGVNEKWHRAYHGTRHESLEKILKVGDLAIPGREIVGGQRIRELPGHFCDDRKPEGFNTKKVFLSPSIHYAGRSTYAKPAEWRYHFQTYSTRVAFQVFISPGSYQVGPETIGARRQLDKKVSNSEIEWSTNQQGSTILYGLLVKVDNASS